jgi:aminopeptidase
MFEDFAPRLAQILTGYSLTINKGDYVLLTGSVETEPMIIALYEALLDRGANPIVMADLPNLLELKLRKSNDDQLGFCDPTTLFLFEKIDAYYGILAPANTKNLAKIDPARLVLWQQGRRPLIEKYMKRINDKSLKWNLSAWPTQAAAQQAEMGLLAYTEFIYNACALDKADPVAHWKGVRARQDKLVEWLKGKKHAEVRGPGIDMSFDFTDRVWINCWGDCNFPDGEIFTSPIENSVQGRVEFSFPTVYGGREVNGVKLTFKDGVAVEAVADKSDDYLQSQLKLDEGARRLGEFAVGTNMGIQQFTGETLFDEKIGGTIHMALGMSLAEAGGVNESQIHWDMVHNMRNGGEIWIDGTLFYQNGEFVVG